jgi:Winged helix-turn-helix DNA-binding
MAASSRLSLLGTNYRTEFCVLAPEIGLIPCRISATKCFSRAKMRWHSTSERQMARRHIIDEMDRKILKRLQLDARISNVHLAEAVHLSPSACLERVRSLEKDGLIRRYTADFDLSKISSNVMLLVEVILENHREARRSLGMLQNRRPDRLSHAGALPRHRSLQRTERLHEPR